VVSLLVKNVARNVYPTKYIKYIKFKVVRFLVGKFRNCCPDVAKYKYKDVGKGDV
jgi:hypothetical protein